MILPNVCTFCYLDGGSIDFFLMNNKNFIAKKNLEYYAAQ